MRLSLVLLAAAALSLSVVPAQAVTPSEDAIPPVADAWSDTSPPPASDRVIVRWAAGTGRTDRLKARAEVGTEDFANLGSAKFQVLDLAKGQDPDQAVRDLKANPNVADASRDGYSVLHANEPNDPLFNQLWGLDNKGLNIGGVTSSAPGDDVDALKAWGKTVGDKDVVVADLDDGIRPQHPDLKNRIWSNTDEVPGDGIDNDGNGYVDDTFGMDFAGANIDLVPLVFDNDPTDDISAGHGTHTAGTIAAEGNNGEGITGVAQDATLMPLRVCGWSPTYQGVYCPYSSQIAAINYAGANGAKIANMSLGGTTGDTLVRDAFAANPQVLFVISAGNNGQNNENPGSTTYPCSFDPTTSGITGAVDNVVCVAASDQNDAKASFSNWGKTKVDLAAPGTEILSTYKPSNLLVEATRFEEDFEDDFGFTGWTNEGWTKVNSSPLTSYGVTNDTATQAEGTTRSLTTPELDVEGTAKCRVSYKNLFVDTSWTPFKVYVVWDGVSPGYLPGYLSDRWLDVPNGTKAFSLRFAFERTTGMPSTAGVWVDDVRIVCFDAVPSDYQYLQGTSMAAPHVTGAAALLKAYEPQASTMQLKQALLSSVDPVAQFNPDTGANPIATGGRLNADKALDAVDAIVAPDTTITNGTSGTVADGNAAFEFVSDARTPVTFECALDGGGFTGCSSPYTVSGLANGIHIFQVRAKDLSSAGNVDPTPASASWTVDIPSAPTQPSLQAPGKVKGVKAKRKAKRATVRWKALPGADSYKVRWTKGGKKYSKWVTTTATKKTIRKLSPKKKYKVQIVAVNAVGQSPAVTVKIKKK